MSNPNPSFNPRKLNADSRIERPDEPSSNQTSHNSLAASTPDNVRSIRNPSPLTSTPSSGFTPSPVPPPIHPARGTAAMDESTRQEVARKGGLAVSRNKQHMADIGRRGGESVSRNKQHMADIGRKGGAAARSTRPPQGTTKPGEPGSGTPPSSDA